jgi:hypothetical protein
MISLIHTYEATRPLQHPVGYPWLTGGSDSTLYASQADWVAPNATYSPTANSGKVIINDSDHSYYYTAFVNGSTGAVDSLALRNYLWRNFAAGAGVVFMDPYDIYWTSGMRNLCPIPTAGICTAPDTKYDNARDNMGYLVSYARKMNLIAMTPQPSLCSTGHCLADASTHGEYFVYTTTGNPFTVNLSAAPGTLNVEWFNPGTGATMSAPAITGGSTAQSFTPPFTGDAVLYLKAQ